MLKNKNKKNPILTRAETAKRLNAFIVSGLCVFILGCLVWPLTVRNFRSVAAINVAVAKTAKSKTQLEQLLARIIQEETSDERLDAILSKIEVAGMVRSRQIEFRDHDSLRKALQVSITEREFGYDFRLGFDGLGGDDERELVDMLAKRIATRLTPEPIARRPQKATIDKSIESLATLQVQQSRSFDLATWIVDQIDDDLKSVKLTLAGMGDGAAGLASNAADGKGIGSQFQFASSKKLSEETGDLKATLDSIDLRSLREVLAEIRERMDAQANLIKAELPALPDRLDTGPILVGNPDKISTLPLNGQPGVFSLFLLGFASVIVGSVIAWHFQPFESRGFENARSVGRMLGVPVVAQILAESTTETGESKKRIIPWANRLSATAGLLLFGILVVVAGFILINPEVRDAFYENPFAGCTKIIRTFAGY